MFSKIMYVTVFVSDQDKALDFYTNSFGFQKHADYNGPEGRFLTIAPSRTASLSGAMRIEAR
jgi:catechol 2,3-dioxygenase-like lactoylglutathione lyase family enzyme